MRKQYCTTDQQVSKGCWYALHVDHDSVTVKKPLTTGGPDVVCVTE